ncbi:TEA/ATTS domain family-domain-containing protein [Gloeopeniophorella convolvens]|nr:TEA/ATTS domain family-domain-containing protein [Gloeopeniophorella convolvens]
MSHSFSMATPLKPRGKSKGNRSVRFIPGGNEAIWDDELHAALLEALNIYPPMGRQRIRPTHEGGESHTSLGRCQLIQQYLKQKTGKNRTRKQISSRIQRLRRTHQDDPEMTGVLRVLPGMHTFTATEMMLTLADHSNFASLPMSIDAATPPLLGPGSVESSVCSSPSANLFGDPFYSGASSSSSIDSSRLTPALLDSVELGQPPVNALAGPEIHAPVPVPVSRSDQENVWPVPELRLPNRASASLSRRRASSNIPTLHYQLDLPPVPSFSFSGSGYDYTAPSASSEAEQQPFVGYQFPYLTCQGQSADPITPVDQIIHTPDLPPQAPRYDKRAVYYSNRVEKDSALRLATNTALSSYLPQPNSSALFSAECDTNKTNLFHTSRAQNYSYPSSPVTSFATGVDGVSQQQFSFGSEGTYTSAHMQNATHMGPQLPRRLSYPQDSRFLGSTYTVRTSPLSYSRASDDGSIANALGGMELASPAVIRPYFVSGAQCSASDGSLDAQNSLSDLAMASLHDGALAH